MTDPTPDVVTTYQAAQILGRTRWQVHHLIRTGALTPCSKLDGVRGAMLFRRPDVEALAASLRESGEVA